MNYKRVGDVICVRMDRNDEIIRELTNLCREQEIPSATFRGIGGCTSAEIQTFVPETGRFETESIDGMLELITIGGNITRDDDGEYHHHAHAMLSYMENDEHRMAAGHVREASVLYTAEIELHPVRCEGVRRSRERENNREFKKFEQ